MKLYRQFGHIFQFSIPLTIVLLFQSCLFEPFYNSVAILENKTDSIIYITTPIDIIYIKGESKIIFKPYQPDPIDIISVDTNSMKGTFKVKPNSSVTLLEHMHNQPTFAIDFLAIKSAKQEIKFTSNTKIENAFIKSEKDIYKLTIDR